MPNRYLSKEADRLIDRIIAEYRKQHVINISRSDAIIMLSYGNLKPLPEPFERTMIREFMNISANKLPLLDMLNNKTVPKFSIDQKDGKIKEETR
jgi:hypothetical protein